MSISKFLQILFCALSSCFILFFVEEIMVKLNFSGYIFVLIFEKLDNLNTLFVQATQVSKTFRKLKQLHLFSESDLSSLSHLGKFFLSFHNWMNILIILVLDAPNDVIFMICGVIIAMLLVGLIIVLVAVTIKWVEFLTK